MYRQSPPTPLVLIATHPFVLATSAAGHLLAPFVHLLVATCPSLLPSYPSLLQLHFTAHSHSVVPLVEFRAIWDRG
ncbi:hypothetical protein BD769DRAFT_237170 [Suillus cothurnatus]|nr:hypothetical protein BD769DRAFT_237170 [Suillus cothurnatus]